MTPPSDAAEILKLIENVDPSDEKMMDEIDGRVLCYLTKNIFVRMLDGSEIGAEFPLMEYQSAEYTYNFHKIPVPEMDKYTRSRDALKAIRPEGYQVGSLTLPCGKSSFCIETEDGITFSVEKLHIYQPKNLPSCWPSSKQSTTKGHSNDPHR